MTKSMMCANWMDESTKIKESSALVNFTEDLKDIEVGEFAVIEVEFHKGLISKSNEGVKSFNYKPF